MNIKRAVVTGGSGFIGSHLVKALHEKGVDVAVVVRYKDVARNPRLAKLWDQLVIIEADLRHRDSLQRMMGFKPDAVFHLAAYNHVGDSFRQVEECYDVNAKGSANVLDVVNGYARAVYVSSSEVYGDQNEVPWKETMAANPKSPYAITKYAGELHARMLQRLNFPVRIVRPFNTYGPGQSSKAFISELIQKGLAGSPIRTTLGEQTREFNYVTDTVRGIILAAECDEHIEGPVNVASGQEIEIRELARKIHELTGATSDLKIGAEPYRPNEIWRMKADTTIAREMLGYEAVVPLEEGLRATVEWFKERL